MEARPPSEEPAFAAADDRVQRAAQVVRERLRAGAPEDDPITREALVLMSDELRELAERVR